MKIPMLRLASLWSVFALFFVAVMSGCGGKPSLVGFTGEVKLDGKPLPKASVQFHPIDDKGAIDHKASPAVGQTDESGKFTLKTPNEGDGVFPGKYKVTVEANSMRELTAEEKAFPGKSVTVPVKPLVAPEFTEAGKSPLSVTVPPSSTVLEVKGPGK